MRNGAGQSGGEVRMLSKATKEGVRSEAKSGGRRQGGGDGKEEK